MLNEIIVQRGMDGAPTPGLDALPGLAERSEPAGSPVDLVIDDAAHRLSPLRQAAVHRVVQECLTNAAKHAPGEKVTVRVALRGDRLRITVSNAAPHGGPRRRAGLRGHGHDGDGGTDPRGGRHVRGGAAGGRVRGAGHPLTGRTDAHVTARRLLRVGGGPPGCVSSAGRGGWSRSSPRPWVVHRIAPWDSPLRTTDARPT